MQERSGRAFRFGRWAMMVGSLLAIAGCPGSLANPERFFVDAGLEAGPIVIPTEDAAPVADAALDADDQGCPPDVPTGLLAPRCALQPCHSSETANAGLDLQAADVGKRLLGKPSSQQAGFFIIDPSGAEKSALYTKVTPTPPYGNRMPNLGNPPLNETQQACLLAWVKAVIAAGPPSDAAADAPTD